MSHIRFPPPRRAASASRPDWAAVTFEALHEQALLARVFVSMGFAWVLTIRHGASRLWPPRYARGPGARRHGFARLNRSLRDADLHMLGLHPRIYLVSAWDGGWRSWCGAQLGNDLPSLAALIWGCSYGQAAARLAGVIGLRDIPGAA